MRASGATSRSAKARDSTSRWSRTRWLLARATHSERAQRLLRRRCTVRLSRAATTRQRTHRTTRCWTVSHQVGNSRPAALAFEPIVTHYLGPAPHYPWRHDHRYAVRVNGCARRKLAQLAQRVRVGLRHLGARAVPAVEPDWIVGRRVRRTPVVGPCAKGSGSKKRALLGASARASSPANASSAGSCFPYTSTTYSTRCRRLPSPLRRRLERVASLVGRWEFIVT